MGNNLAFKVLNIISVFSVMSLIFGISTDWNQPSEGAIGTSHDKMHIFKTRFRKVETSEGK